MSDWIASRTNSRVKVLRRNLRQRSPGQLQAEGIRLIEELLSTGLQIEAAAYSPQITETKRGQAILAQLQALSPPLLLPVSQDVLASLADTRSPQGLIVLAKGPEWGGQSEWLQRCGQSRVSLVLDGVADAGNVGTIWRSAGAFAAGPLLLGPACAELTSPKVTRASMGAAFHHPAWQTDELLPWLQAAQREGLTVLAATPGPQAVPLSRYPFAPGTLVVIGSEAHGLSPEVSELATGCVAIPMPGEAESLNAAMAAAIVMYEAQLDRS